MFESPELTSCCSSLFFAIYYLYYDKCLASVQNISEAINIIFICIIFNRLFLAWCNSYRTKTNLCIEWAPHIYHIKIDISYSTLSRMSVNTDHLVPPTADLYRILVSLHQYTGCWWRIWSDLVDMCGEMDQLLRTIMHLDVFDIAWILKYVDVNHPNAIPLLFAIYNNVFLK